MDLTQTKSIIKARHSCRAYTGIPLSPVDYANVITLIGEAPFPPFESKLRFQLIASHKDDQNALKGLGTYGLLKGVPAYLAGIVTPGPTAMEDLGYVMESLVLKLTALGLGTCWLGGTLTKSTFARRVDLQGDEALAVLIALGYASGKRLLRERLVRRAANSDRRLPWESLFFDGNFSQPLSEVLPSAYVEALLAVRRGPSASNKQPWRIVRDENDYHFYISRSTNYTRMLKTAGLVDLQRNDLGIAMCHFESILREEGINGEWYKADTSPNADGSTMQYIATWQETD